MALVQIYATTDPYQGELVRARLESEGISVLLKGGGEPYRVGPVYLFVDEADESDAKLVVNDLDGEPAADPQVEGGPVEDEPAR